MSSELSFPFQLWGHGNNWKGDMDHDLTGRREYTFLGCKLGSSITAWPSRSLSGFYFLPRCPHLPPWVGVHRIFSTCHTWGFPQVKIVGTNLNAAEEALEAYQREKQQRLNELLVVIPLKLHQVMVWRGYPTPSEQKNRHTQAFPEEESWVPSGEKYGPLLRVVEWHPNFSLCALRLL